MIGAHTDVYGVDDFAAADVVDAKDVRVGYRDVFEYRVVADVVREAAQDVHHTIGVCAGVHGYGKRCDGVVAGLVGDRGNLAVGNEIEGAVTVAQSSAAQRGPRRFP